MRKNRVEQLPFMLNPIETPQSRELKQISKILYRNPMVCDLVLRDLLPSEIKSSKGANGMSAEQVLRASIVKQMYGYSYKNLAFHLLDSIALRKFCHIGIFDKGFKKSALCDNIKCISPKTWESINRILAHDAEQEGIEKGREIRVDCTAVESDIHPPTDSTLLWDCVRVLTRLMNKAFEDGNKISFQNHTRRSKRRMIAIENSNSSKHRKKQYRDLIKVTKKVTKDAKNAIEYLKKYGFSLAALAISEELARYVELTQKVLNQTYRRVFKNETVPASEKIFSIFEEHTDIIIKDRRNKFYGHKICLTGGKSNLIIDCQITEGNPADSTLASIMVERQNEIYDRYPLKAAFDGGFASKANLADIKLKGVKDVCFAKKRGLKVENMCRSEWVYKRLRNFRAGIESGISWLKRSFGLTRCTWKGFESFKSYVWASIVSANLLTMARAQL